jgi:hypothetical protein
METLSFDETVGTNRCVRPKSLKHFTALIVPKLRTDKYSGSVSVRSHLHLNEQAYKGEECPVSAANYYS